MLPLTLGAGVFLGAACGIALGAVAGGAAGAAVILAGDRLGWRVAALLGGLAPGLALAGLALWTRSPIAYVLFGIPSLIAAGLGIAVSSGIRRGRSSVPGVQHLVSVINDVRGQPEARRLDAPAEVLPASSPSGRGDEIAPAG